MSMIGSGGIFGPLERLSGYVQIDDLLEARFENDGNGNPIYIGYCPIPNSPVNQPIWFIIKVEYVGEAVVRKRLPDDGAQFTYQWALRATYFS